MHIVYQEEAQIFHLYNDTVSYIMKVLPNGHLGQLYFGKRINADKDYSILCGKPELDGLPATYAETPEEAKTLRICLKDEVTDIRLGLLYTIFETGAIARSATIVNEGERMDIILGTS